MKNIDFSKFRKDVTKNIPGIATGFNDPRHWIDTGNYALNYLISNDFYRGIPMGKITLLSGESGCLPESAKVTIRYRKKNSSLNVDYVEKEVTVKELKDMYASDEYDIEISSPDGYQKIVNWFDKGTLDMVEVITESQSTRCAVNHLLQRADDTWVMASEVSIGDELLTENGIEEVVELNTNVDPEECYDFEVNHVNHRYWGDGISSHNSGKSFISAGSIAKHAQADGTFVVLLDSENALDEQWLSNAGVSTDDDKLLRIGVAMVDDVASIVTSFIKQYREDYGDDIENGPKVLFVMDSLGMLLTPTDKEQFEKGDLKGDMGRKAKSITALLRNLVHVIEPYNIAMVCTNHVYDSQNMFDPEPKISGGNMVVFAPSISVALSKFKLKEDEEGKKVTDVRGIRAKCKVLKSRFAKPFETIELQIPYDGGLTRTTGLFDLLGPDGMGYLKKVGNRYSYKAANGEEIIEFKKVWLSEPEYFERVVKEVSEKLNEIEPVTTSDEAEDNDELATQD